MAHVNRRSFLKKTAATLLGVATSTPLAANAAAERQQQSAQGPRQTPVQLVNRGELSVLFGDSTSHGVGRDGFCGIWSLCSVHDPHNAFVSGYAGFIFNTHRGRPVEMRRLSQHQAVFRFKDPTLDTRVLFTVREPYYVDSTTTVIPQVKVAAPYLLQSWASYINSPLSGDILFLHEGNWIRASSPQHGMEATYCPTSLRDIEDDLRHLSPQERKGSFHYGYSEQRFSEPFYYGRIRTMALAFFFDTFDNIRFLISPTGGGPSVIPGKACPAWDWLWLIPHPKPGKAYRLRVRTLYKYFAGREDIIAEYNRWRSTLQGRT